MASGQSEIESSMNFDDYFSAFTNKKHKSVLKGYCIKLKNKINPTLTESQFLELLREKPHGEITKYADEFILEFLEKKYRTMTTFRKTYNSHLKAWKLIGINVSDGAKQKANLYLLKNKTEGPQKDVTKVATEFQQVKNLSNQKDAMVEKILKTTPAEFKQKVQSLLKQDGVNKSIEKVLTTVPNKSDQMVYTILFVVATYVQLASATGIRLGQFMDIPWGQYLFTKGEHGVLFQFLNNKSSANPLAFTMVVPGKYPRKDPLIMMALLFRLLENVKYKVNKDRIFKFFTDSDIASNIQNFYSSILFVFKKEMGIETKNQGMHAWRKVTTNLLVDSGTSDEKINAHLQWKQGTIMNNHYLDKLNKAKLQNEPYKLAHRDSKEDPPHPIWDKIGTNHDSLESYLSRIADCAIAAGYCGDVYKEFVKFDNPALGKDIGGYVNLKQTEEQRKRKRTREEIEEENLQLKAKLLKLEQGIAKNTNNPFSKVVESVDQMLKVDKVTLEDFDNEIQELKTKVKEEDFPELCLQAYTQKIRPMVAQLQVQLKQSMHNTRLPSFIRPTDKGGIGKPFKQILMIVGAHLINKEALKRNSTKSSWLQLCVKQKNIFEGVDVSSYRAFEAWFEKVAKTLVAKKA